MVKATRADEVAEEMLKAFDAYDATKTFAVSDAQPFLTRNPF